MSVRFRLVKMLEIMERDNIFEESYKKGCYLRDKFLELQKQYDIIGDVRGIGLDIGVDLVTNRETMERNVEATAKICYYCMTHGLLLVFLALSSLRVQPPLVITYEEIDKGFEIIKDAFAAYAAGELGDDILEKCKGW